METNSIYTVDSLKKAYTPPRVIIYKKADIDNIVANMSYGCSNCSHRPCSNCSNCSNCSHNACSNYPCSNCSNLPCSNCSNCSNCSDGSCSHCSHTPLPAIGTEENPRVITLDEQWSFEAASYWVTFECQGTMRINVTSIGGGSPTVIVYKKELFGKILLGSYLDTVITKTFDTVGHATYLVHFYTPSSTTLKIKIGQNIDRCNDYDTPFWIPYEDSGRMFNEEWYHLAWHIKPIDIGYLLEWIEKSPDVDFTDLYTRVVAGEVKLMTMILSKLVIPQAYQAKVLGVVYTYLFCVKLADLFKQFFINEAKRVSNYNEVTQKSTKPIRVELFQYQETKAILVHPWGGGEMTGPTGYRGHWEQNKQ